MSESRLKEVDKSLEIAKYSAHVDVTNYINDVEFLIEELARANKRIGELETARHNINVKKHSPNRKEAGSEH